MFDKYFCKLVNKKNVTLGDALVALICRPITVEVLKLMIAGLFIGAFSIFCFYVAMHISAEIINDIFNANYHPFVALIIMCLIILSITLVVAILQALTQHILKFIALVYEKILNIQIATCPITKEENNVEHSKE